MVDNPTTVQFTCAIGDSPEQTITAAPTTDLSPLTTNLVHVQNMGPPNPVINNFGGSTSVTYQLRFDQNIVLHHNPPTLTLQTGTDRTTQSGDRGTYRIDQNGNATEVFYSASNVNTIVATLQAQVATLQNQVASLLAAITPSGTSITVAGNISCPSGTVSGSTISGNNISGSSITSSTVAATGNITSSAGNISASAGTVSGLALSAGTSGVFTTGAFQGSSLTVTGEVEASSGTGGVHLTTHTHGGGVHPDNPS